MPMSLQESGYDEGEDLPLDKKTIYALLGSNQTFFCGTSRDSAQRGKWYYYYNRSEEEDKLITDNDLPKIKLFDYTIEVRNVNYSDIGFYVCKIGNVSYEVELNVGEPPSNVTMSIEPLITNDEFSILQIKFGPPIDGHANYMFDIVGINDMNSSKHEWQPAFSADSTKCCSIRYTHYGTSVGGRMRLAIENEYGKSDYIVSDPFVFPNRPLPPFLQLNVVEGQKKLHFEWERQCEHDPLLKSYKLRYRTLQWPFNWTTKSVPKEQAHYEIDVASEADYVFNLVGEGENQNYYSDQLYYRTKRQSPIVGEFKFTKISSKRVTMRFVPPAEFAGKNFTFTVVVYEGNATTSQKRFSVHDFLINIPDLKPNEAYFIDIYYMPLDHTKILNSGKLYVKTSEDIPEAVTNLTTRLLPSTLQNKYAVISVTWDAPEITNGALLGYKIRWKLDKSLDNLFFVEQCDTSYEIKVFYPDEHYSVFVSARTSAGYGPQRATSFKIGSIPGSKPPKRENTTAKVDRTSFEAQLRRKIEHEYAIGYTRVIISACTLVIALIFSWFLKCAILDKGSEFVDNKKKIKIPFSIPHRKRTKGETRKRK